ncbi:MAG: TraR/DksA family transcriptional regulator [Candidatus Omnitrophica bacterium]|nr:TraR/DksA family transcriptional regulator [Candidatus Omnitrophota bacterium]
MPDKMDAKKLDFYKKLLFKMKAQIRGDIKSMSDESEGDQADKGDLSGHAMHMADVATDMYDREFNLSLASNDREVIQRIDAALERIEKKTYGFCLKSGKRIPDTRLKAIPYAEYCLDVQEEMDRKGNR